MLTTPELGTVYLLSAYYDDRFATDAKRPVLRIIAAMQVLVHSPEKKKLMFKHCPRRDTQGFSDCLARCGSTTKPTQRWSSSRSSS